MSEKPLLLDRAALNVAMFASKDGMQSPFVNVRIGDGVAEATNGHYLLRVPLPNQGIAADWPANIGPNGDGMMVKETTLPAESATAISKAIPKKNTLPILNHAALWLVGGQVEAYTTDLEKTGTVRAMPSEMKFPETSKVIPAADLGRAVTLSAKYLRDLCDYAIKHGGDKPSVTLQIGTEAARDCVRIEIDLEPDRVAVGALMPMQRG